MTKQEILNECARRVGDESAAFITAHLSPAFDFVLLELAQQGCLDFTRKQTTFTFGTPSGAAANNVWRLDTAGVCGSIPVRITGDPLVPAWGVAQGRILRVSDMEFENRWLSNTNDAGRPAIWRPYPTVAKLEFYPAPLLPDNASINVLLEWEATPATLNPADVIAEVEAVDMPTLLAGLYKAGIIYRDDALNDAVKAEADWQRGLARMRERRVEQQHFGRRTQIMYRDF